MIPTYVGWLAESGQCHERSDNLVPPERNGSSGSASLDARSALVIRSCANALAKTRTVLRPNCP